MTVGIPFARRKCELWSSQREGEVSALAVLGLPPAHGAFLRASARGELPGVRGAVRVQSPVLPVGRTPGQGCPGRVCQQPPQPSPPAALLGQRGDRGTEGQRGDRGTAARGAPVRALCL